MTRVNLNQEDFEKLVKRLNLGRKDDMDVTGKFFLVEKHKRIKGKPAKRRFNEQEDIPTMVELAKQYAQQRGEDFLIVQVVAEVSKPETKSNDLHDTGRNK